MRYDLLKEANIIYNMIIVMKIAYYFTYQQKQCIWATSVAQFKWDAELIWAFDEIQYSTLESVGSISS